MSSEIHTIIAKRVYEEGHKLRQEKVDPWIFMPYGEPFQVKNFYGKLITYRGVAFEGTPQNVFWSNYIEPFLENIVEQVISDVAKEAIERHIKLDAPMSEAEEYLKKLVLTTYERMAEIDQLLRGKGNPGGVTRRSVESKILAMEQFIAREGQGQVLHCHIPWGSIGPWRDRFASSFPAPSII